ncbi:MAG: immunoglobulin domain-containing protein [Planctomycetes bacterium]|nr:immunoglobulin domain-containing protein [Planctomycetota bacterium]
MKIISMSIGHGAGPGGSAVRGWGCAWLALAMLVSLLCVRGARGQCEAQWLRGWDVAGIDEYPTGAIELPDGDLLVASYGQACGGTLGTGLFRYARATAQWSLLVPGLTGGIKQLADGDFLVFGQFTTIGGMPANGIVRYHLATNTWSALGSGVAGGVSPRVIDVAVLADGSVIAAGFFTSAGGHAASNIARYDFNTGDWTSLGSGVGGAVRAVAILPDGSLGAGGGFRTAGDTANPVMARYDFQTQAWGPLGAGFVSANQSDNVFSLIVLPNGDVLAGGKFYTSSGIPIASGMRRCTFATGAWTEIAIDASYVNTMDMDRHGQVWFGGGSSSALRRLDPATNVMTAVPSRSSIYYNCAFVKALRTGEVLMGGRFGSVQNVPARSIALYSPDTNRWSGLSVGFDDSIYCLKRLSNGDVVAGGDFVSAGGVPARRVARFHPSTNSWSALGDGLSGTVVALAELPNGDLLAARPYPGEGVRTSDGLSRFSQTTGQWNPVPGTTNLDGVRVLTPRPDGTIVVAGRFSIDAPTVGSMNNIVLYDPASNSVRPLLSSASYVVATRNSFDPGIAAATVNPNGDVIVAGQFTNGSLHPWVENIGRYIPATDSWLPIGSRVFGGFSAVATLPNGDILVGGSGLRPEGVSGSGALLRCSAATGTWTVIPSAAYLSDRVSCIEALSDHEYLVAGQFNGIGGVAAKNLARFDANTNSWSAIGPALVGGNFSPDVMAVTTTANGDIVAGGAFSHAGEVVSAHFARFGVPAPIFTMNPTPVTACPAGTASLRVAVASGDTPTYQWRKDGTAIDLATNPSAATATLTFAGTAATDEGVYDCVVTNGCGTATSLPAVLTVCTGDFNCDGGADGADIEAFFAAWGAGAAVADINADGGVNGADIGAFFDVWVQGC